MKLAFWLKSLFSGSGRRSRRSLPHHRGRYRNQPLAAQCQFLEARVMLAADFGDAPVPYPTTLAEDGAQRRNGSLSLGGI